MQLSAILPLLAVAAVQKALCTHLETCPCHQIEDLVNTTVQQAVARLEDRLTSIISSTVSDKNSSALESRLTEAMQKLLAPIQQQLDYHLPFPHLENSEDHPALSCKDLHTKYPHASSGYYWINSGSGSPVRVYCAMNMSTCGHQTGGWMRVANLDMRNTSQTCPNGLTLLSSPKRLCDVTGNKCVGNHYSTEGVPYSHVCGRVIGYHYQFPDAFYYRSRGIDREYVCGVSLTHGSPRKHIWTFAGAQDEHDSNERYVCPCTNTASTSYVPSFVGNDYFCDTGIRLSYSRYSSQTLHTADPLWDGKGCGPTSSCCSFNNPPWFQKDLTSPTTDSIEMRVCRPDGNSSTPIEIVELYVQ